jgi:outer membrane protein insertion porin family
LLLVCALAAGAENDLNNALIGSVSVMIDDLPAGESIEKLIAVQPGEFFSLKKINFSIKQIYKTGLFSDVRVVREGEERIRLTFLLTSRPFSRGFTITGMDSAPRSRLTNKVYSVRTGEPYTEERLLRSVEELREAMSDEGMFEADIHAYAEKVEGSTQVDVFFDIRSAKTYSVSRILFSGMLLFTRDQLLHKMGTKEGGAYAPSALREDVLRL